MKAFLMYPDRDFDSTGALPANAATLIQDLELDTLFRAMAAGDEYLLEVAKRGLLWSLTDSQTIQYRQHVVADCLERSDIIRRAYVITIDALEGERQVWGWSSQRQSADLSLGRALRVMKLFVPLLRDLREMADGPGAGFRSEGFKRFWKMLSVELSEEYLNIVEGHLQRLTFPAGVVFSAALGDDNRGVNHVLREPPPVRRWWEWLQVWQGNWQKKRSPSYTYEVPPRDEAGHQALGDLRRRGIARTAAALSRSADHVLQFFRMLRAELAFYIGCINLHERLAAQRQHVCFPAAHDAAQRVFSAESLYDVSLALKIGKGVVANNVNADGRTLVMITGANRGGKSTLLRSVGQAQLMMQGGLFVCAASLRSNVCKGIFTHYKREEDVTMRSGKLDEELNRMSDIVDHIRAGSLLLCNESFGSTNEREGSEIARQIVKALLESGIKVFYVTHLFDLADGFRKAGTNTTLFLRAQRMPDGQRTFRLEVGDPLSTSYGQDLYRRIFLQETGRHGRSTDASVREMENAGK